MVYGDVRLKKNPSDAVQIRWIYQVDPPKKPDLSYKKKDKSKKDNSEEFTKLDMNLHYQRVGIAIGDNQNEGILEGIVTRYNGIPIPIDAFEGKKEDHGATNQRFGYRSLDDRVCCS